MGAFKVKYEVCMDCKADNSSGSVIAINWEAKSETVLFGPQYFFWAINDGCSAVSLRRMMNSYIVVDTKLWSRIRWRATLIKLDVLRDIKLDDSHELGSV
jgi:hypothetical protein